MQAYNNSVIVCLDKPIMKKWISI